MKKEKGVSEYWKIIRKDSALAKRRNFSPAEENAALLTIGGGGVLRQKSDLKKNQKKGRNFLLIQKRKDQFRSYARRKNARVSFILSCGTGGQAVQSSTRLK